MDVANDDGSTDEDEPSAPRHSTSSPPFLPDDDADDDVQEDVSTPLSNAPSTDAPREPSPQYPEPFIGEGTHDPLGDALRTGDASQGGTRREEDLGSVDDASPPPGSPPTPADDQHPPNTNV